VPAGIAYRVRAEVPKVSRDGTPTWGRWLRWYRADRDLTQEELGEALGVDGKTISAWENGQRPGRRHARTICATLHTTRAELGLVEPGPGPAVGRRDFLRRSAGVGALAIFGPWAGVDRIDLPGLDGFEATTELLGRLWVRAGAAAALGPTLGHVESVTRLLQGSLPGAVRPRLCGLLAESAVLLAVFKSWMGDPDGADHFAALAFDAAREAGDPDLAVHVLVTHTSGDRRLHDEPDLRLRRYVEGDHGFAVAAARPATRAWAATAAAGVHAALGRAEACLWALDEAEALLAGASGRRYPWPDERWLAGERGASLARLGRPAEARRALDAALAGTGDERAVDRLWWMLAGARVHAREGDPGRAARVALDVLSAARRFRHGQLEDEVARVRAALAPAPGQALRALDEALSTP
jgi:transcriptional regulator with XRE-family HTH domain